MTGQIAAACAATKAHACSAEMAEFDTAQGGIDCRAISNRREAESLFAVDAVQSGHNSGWEAYFVEHIAEFVVFSRRPTGRITNEDAAWLVDCIGETPSASVPALLRALVRQTEDCPDAILALAARLGVMRG